MLLHLPSELLAHVVDVLPSPDVARLAATFKHDNPSAQQLADRAAADMKLFVAIVAGLTYSTFESYKAALDHVRALPGCTVVRSESNPAIFEATSEEHEFTYYWWQTSCVIQGGFFEMRVSWEHMQSNYVYALITPKAMLVDAPVQSDGVEEMWAERAEHIPHLTILLASTSLWSVRERDLLGNIGFFGPCASAPWPTVVNARFGFSTRWVGLAETELKVHNL